MADDIKKSRLEAALDKAYDDRISYLFSRLCVGWNRAAVAATGQETVDQINEAEELFRVDSISATEALHSIRECLGVGTKKS